MKENVLLVKSFDFAIRVVMARKFLLDEKKEYVMSKQLLRSGTSIGANAEEAVGAHSTADFLSKLSVAYKEARENWIRLLAATGYFEQSHADSLIDDNEELLRIIGKIQITTKNNARN